MDIKDAKGVVIYTINPPAAAGGNPTVTSPNPAAAPVDPALLQEILAGQTVDLSWTLDTLLTHLGKINTASSTDIPKDSKELAKRAEALDKAIAKLKAQGATGTATQKANIQGFIQTAESQLKQLLGQMNAMKDKTGFDSGASATLNTLSAKYPSLANPDGSAPGTGKAQISTPQQQQNAQQSGAAPQQPFPGAGKAQTAGNPIGGFDLNKVLQSSMFQTMGLNSLDTLGKSQMDQKKMMMLFMYFAMMAMSGDIGAMTAFMQFITTIITKDKAMQNVNMANKLIELQDASRKATDELLNTPSYDPNNQQVGADFAKTMEKVKADQGSIATSQKLIAQMMEEFAQVSEFLNNLQKSLLDVRGRILSRSSSFNA